MTTPMPYDVSPAGKASADGACPAASTAGSALAPGCQGRVSACTLDCPGACSLLVEKDAAGTMRVRGNPEHPVTKGVICIKGRRTLERLASPERITTPLIRKNGSLVFASWDEALALCASRIDALRAEPARMLHLRGYGYRGVLADASNRFFNALGASTKHGSLCDGTGDAANEYDFGALDQNDPADLANARGIVNWGRDFSRSFLHMGLMVREARKRGCPVLAISPGDDGPRAHADAHIRLYPGTDRFFAAAALRRLLHTEAGREVACGVASPALLPKALAATANHGALAALLADHTEAQLLAACNATSDDLDTLLRWYCRDDGGAVATIIGWGLQRYAHGGENVRFINALAMLSGNIGRSGGGSYYGFSSGRNLDASWRNANPGPARSFLLPRLADELERATPPVELLWVDGLNVVNQLPDAARMAAVFERIPFKVVVDAFPNDTVRRADVVLPCALVLEREDIIGSYLHNHVQYAGAVLSPRGLARQDFDIMADLASRLAAPLAFPQREEVLRAGIATPWLAHTSLEELRAKGFAKAARPQVVWEGMHFAHADGSYRLPEALHPEPVGDARYPLQLLTLVRADALHSQMSEQGQDALPVVTVAEDCVQLQNLVPGAPVFLATPKGRMAVRVETQPELHPHVVVLRRGGWMAHGGTANPIIEARLTDMGDAAAYYSQQARLEND